MNIKNQHPSTVYWQDLDVLRGLAALFMVFNHSGIGLLSAEIHTNSIINNVLIISSYAPVIFFFTTGVGSGLQSNAKAKTFSWYPVLYKTAILILADLLFQWSVGRWWGLDFLAFIGLSGLLLEFVRNSKYPILISIIGIIVITAARYLLAPFIYNHSYTTSFIGLIDWFLGYKGIAGVSYHFSPWMVYPLLGYLIGRLVARYRPLIEARKVVIIFALLLLSSVPIALAIFLDQHNASFFRWGSMGIGFYVLSFAVILHCLVITQFICGISKLKMLKNLFSLAGIASLAVVPIHYYLINITKELSEHKINFIFKFSIYVSVG